MSDLPDSANVVVIGAGIVGNSVVGHLAELGWRDIVQIDTGPLPNPGGSTGHASNFIFPVDHNKEMAMLTLDSQRQYTEMGLNVACGGVEIAREPQRLEEFRRRITSAKAWGIDAWLVSPKEVLELVSFKTLTPQEMDEARADARALEDRAYRISKDVFGRTPRAQSVAD